MWTPRSWAAASHRRAVDNARAASTECSRRRLERTELALFLEEHAARRRDERHIVAAAAEHRA